MGHSLKQNQLDVHRHRPLLWARRLVGLAIVLSGGALLASDPGRFVGNPVAPAVMSIQATP